MRANFVLSGVAVGIRRNVLMTLALVLSTSIALGFLSAALLANTEINNFRTLYEDKLSVTVNLCPVGGHQKQLLDIKNAQQHNERPRGITCADDKPTSSERADQIEAMLKADSRIKSVSYISAEHRLDLARARHVLGADLIQVGVLPAAFVVGFHDLKHDYPAVAAKFNRVPGVDEVNNQFSTIKSLLDLIDGLRIFSLIIAIAVLVASVLLMSNTIQVAAAQRRNETNIMRLVGASRWMTELPFMLEAVVAAVVGGLISIGFVWLGKHYILDGIFRVQVERQTIPNLSINDVLVAGGAGILIGIVLSALTAFATLRLYVRL